MSIFYIENTTLMEYTYKYPHPAVTTDCIIFGYDVKEDLSVLVGERVYEELPLQLRLLADGVDYRDESAVLCLTQ